VLKEFVNNVLGPNDDIVRFEFMQKNNRETGPALVGLELQSRADYKKLLNRMTDQQIDFLELNTNDKLFNYHV